MTQPAASPGVCIVKGDARRLRFLPDNSVDLIVTSPPYWALRSYQDTCPWCQEKQAEGIDPRQYAGYTEHAAQAHHYRGQIGSEPSRAEYIDNLIDCTAEWMRVLKPSGSLWVNLGDKYAGNSQPGGQASSSLVGTKSHSRGMPGGASSASYGAPQKSLIGLPWRYAIRCIDSLGLILRAEVVWDKPNGLPESVTDRVRRSHETWFHFTKAERYYAAIDTIREPYADQRPAQGMSWQDRRARGDAVRQGEQNGTFGSNGMAGNPLGRLPGSVWRVASQPLKVPAELGTDHYAAFPMEWPRRIIQGWSPSGICADCGFLLGSSYDYGMLGVRKELRAAHPQRQTSDPLLFEALLESEQRPQSEEHQVPPADDSGVRGDLEAGSPDGTEERLHDGAPLRHVRASGASAGSVRGGSPQERDQDGQPDREPGAARQDRARSTPQACAQAVPVPALRRNDPDVRNPQSCPHCGGTSVRPSVVADFFGGTGTTALVADVLGRQGISVDKSADYCRIAVWRCNDPKQRERAARPARAET